jgi:TetR/AcrR family transcriptional repressor of bet genes
MGRPSLAGPRRKQIIDGLRAAILKHGIAEASVQRIAAEAKLPAGLVHHYFVSKEDLLIATVDQVVEDLGTPLRAELQVLDPERALARGLDFLFVELPANRERSVLFAEIGVAALRRPQLRKRLAALDAEVATELTAMLDRLPDCQGRHAENADFAMLLVCLLSGADVIWHFDSGAINPRRLRRMVEELVARHRGASNGKTDGRATPHDRGLRGHRARRRAADRQPAKAR